MRTSQQVNKSGEPWLREVCLHFREFYLQVPHRVLTGKTGGRRIPSYCQPGGVVGRVHSEPCPEHFLTKPALGKTS